MTMADKLRLFKKKMFKSQELVHLVLQGAEGTATRSIYTGPRELPRVEVCFKVPYGKDPRSKESFDAIEIEMDLYAATEFAQQLLHTIDAASPRQPRQAYRTQYGE